MRLIHFYRPNNPYEAKFLTSREKYIVIQRKASDNTGIESKTFKVEQVWEAIWDIKTWLVWIAIVALQVRLYLRLSEPNILC